MPSSLLCCMLGKFKVAWFINMAFMNANDVSADLILVITVG